jgi:transcriptional regulator with XRE-family HTH domain
MRTPMNPEPIRVTREARLRKRLTQFSLARRVGCSESQIAKIETGRANPPRWLKEAVARELDIQTWEVGL